MNTRIDHPGLLLDRNADVAAIVRAVDAPNLRLLYDVYHSVAQGEDVATEFAAAADLVRYVHVADFPGRGEPGSGAVDWARILDILDAGRYSGSIALEFVPSTDIVTAATHIRALIAHRADASAE